MVAAQRNGRFNPDVSDGLLTMINRTVAKSGARDLRPALQVCGKALSFRCGPDLLHPEPVYPSLNISDLDFMSFVVRAGAAPLSRCVSFCYEVQLPGFALYERAREGARAPVLGDISW